MTTRSPTDAEMDRLIDDYMARLRRSMRGASPDVADEVEREIRAHIDDALAVRERSDAAALRDVLERLGPPEDYARDVALYEMVDRGYREWSLPHMVRSTAFWALSTVAGAVVVLIFALLYAAAAGLAAVGVLRAFLRLVPPSLLETLTGLQVSTPPGGPPSLLGALLTVAAGVLLLAGLTAIVRWFVGQYVRSARPHTLGGPAADAGWVTRTSRRILVTAVTGLVVTLLAGLASGVYRLGAWTALSLPADFTQSPLALVSGLGLALFLLAPVLGLLWTALAEG